MADIILKDINSGTAIHDFPDIYNKNNTELINTIQELQKEIEDLKSSHKKDVDDLKSKFNTWKATHETEFDNKMTEFEKTFVTKDEYEKDVIKYYQESSDFKSVVRSIVESIINENK
jgi:predicted transcriptional regulator